MSAQCAIHIGTSGWHYKHWVGKFYPERFPPAQMLAWYAREFHTVEINNSFYRLPEEKTFVAWKHNVPPGFLFSVKASRFLTHIKRLKDPESSIALFFSRAIHLGSSLGPVLFQLPPKWKADVGRLEHFLSALPRGHRYVLEFRDQSWLSADVLSVLRRHGVALCLHDWRAGDWPLELTADFTYVRFHGFERQYGGNYSEQSLQKWATRIQEWSYRLYAVFAYFNNDAQGYAIDNARTLRQMIEARLQGQHSAA